ncbi:MAG: radical SAM protein [Clostridiales bacterium]|nr:radical SAM protein [Clostridiales bacterium]
MIRTITEGIMAFVYRQVLSYMSSDPITNVPKVLDWLEKHDRGNAVTRQSKAIRKVFEDENSNWHQLLVSLWTDIDAGVRQRLFETIVINGSLVSIGRKDRSRKKYGCNIPWAILVDPTSACNLNCVGCWASEYGNQLNLSLDELENIIQQGKKLGCYIYIYSGGEPLVRKKDIITLCERHPECAFLAFTNGTLIDESFVNDMLRVKNFIPAISVEGFKQETDFRRGEGTYDAVIRAMRILKEKKLLFGVSCCYTSKNIDAVSSEAYFDAILDWGAKFAWFFTYMPVGQNAMPELMVNAEQRMQMYEKLRGYRKTKPLFTIDFWNDGESVKGCVAGGRGYLHISAGGEIEPCAFVHYSDSNIREKTLLEALRSPLFMQYHANQPFNENMLRPCPVLDNPDMLRDMVERTSSHSTQVRAPEDARDYCGRCIQRAEEWAPVAAKLWERSHPKAG